MTLDLEIAGIAIYTAELQKNSLFVLKGKQLWRQR